MTPKTKPHKPYRIILIFKKKRLFIIESNNLRNVVEILLNGNDCRTLYGHIENLMKKICKNLVETI